MSKSAPPPTTLRGLVEAVYYSGPRFTAGRLRTAAGELVNFAGNVFAKVNDPVILRGDWADHPKYGRQFAATGMEHDLALTPEGLANYLANHPEIRGIGPVKAQMIAERFGADFDRVIREQPELVAQAAKVPLETILGLQRHWTATSDFNAAMTFLAAYDLTHFQVTTLVGRFGNKVVPMLQADPYILVREIPGFGFKRVDKIARKLGTPKDLPSRIRAGLLYTVDEALDDGDCWVEYEDLLDRANTLLVMDTLDSRERIEQHLEALIGEGALACTPFERLVVAKAEIQRMEEYLAEVLRHGAAPNPHFADSGQVEQLIDFQAPELNVQQRQAVANALRHSISLIAGGAGSGKTYSVSTIVNIARLLEWSVVMAAPTGKAAKRLEEVVHEPASTIHRLLGFDGHTFAKGADDHIEADILVIDELSMVDVPLAWQLFQAVDLTKTAVVLVGDHNQLPPVGPGNVMRDLVQSQAVPTTVLSQVIRQAGVLKENSTAVLEGEVRPTAEVQNHGRRPWYVVDKFTDRQDVRDFLLLLFDEVLADRLGFDLIRDVQVLTPTHKGPLGTVELNIALQRLIHRKLFGFDVPELEPGKRPRLYPHDKVIQTRNDYDLGVMNGATGIVLEASDREGLAVNFDGHVVLVPKEKQDHIQLGLACSIHKVQGSEFPCAIIIAHKSHAFMHHRNLLYTAVTRAKETAIILGDRWGIDNCAQKRQVDQRNTFLSFLLRGDA